MPLLKKSTAPTLDDHLATSKGISAGVLDTFEEMVLDLHNANEVAYNVAAQADAEADRLRALATEAHATAYRNEQVITNIRALTAAPSILGKA